ncbi:hypothetical protein MRX96_050075 [Rhipicephalus microplus]
MTGWNPRSEPRRSQSDTRLVPGFVLSTCGVEYEGPDSVEVARDPNSWYKQLTFLPGSCPTTSTGAHRHTTR